MSFVLPETKKPQDIGLSIWVTLAFAEIGVRVKRKSPNWLTVHNAFQFFKI